MKTDVSYGYGISGEDLGKITPERMSAFARKHVNDCKGISDEILEEWLEEVEDDTTTATGPYALIAHVISEETGILFSYEHTEYGEAVMFYKAFPWEYREAEKNLTPEKMQEIFQPYLEELGIADVQLDNVEVEMYG